MKLIKCLSSFKHVETEKKSKRILSSSLVARTPGSVLINEKRKSSRIQVDR